MALKAEVLAELEELSDGDEGDLLKELVGMFENNARSLTLAMRTALISKDAKGFERAAHSLKGSAAGLGLEQTAEVCLRLENRGRQLNLDGCEKELEQAEGELKTNIVLLKDYLENRKTKSGV